MKKIKRILFLFLILISSFSFAQLEHKTEPKSEETSLVKWLTFSEAFELNKKQPKPFLVDIYTEWCGWCKHMMKTTYSDPEVSNYINSWFYPVKFDAECKDTIEYLGTKYFNEGKEKRSVHQLAVKFLGNQLSYPSTIFVSNNFQFNLNTAGYLDSKKILPILVYTVENVFRTTPFEEFKTQFERTFFDTTQIKSPQWSTFNKAMELNKKKPKKTMIFIHTDWCNSCRIMSKTTFSDPNMLEYLKKNYYLIDLNADNRDTIIYKNQTFVNNHNNTEPFHQLVLALTKNNVVLPTIVILNEQEQIIDGLPFYVSPNNLETVSKYFGDNVYLKTKWEDYLKKVKEEDSSNKEIKKTK